MRAARDFFATVFARAALSSMEAQRALSRWCVNASSSGHCFFSHVGVFGKKCISILECTQRLSHLTSEGTMAKKAKKKAKSAVKKTAKKTRKVSKKK
jgi:hypothetical protein